MFSKLKPGIFIPRLFVEIDPVYRNYINLTFPVQAVKNYDGLLKTSTIL